MNTTIKAGQRPPAHELAHAAQQARAVGNAPRATPGLPQRPPPIYQARPLAGARAALQRKPIIGGPDSPAEREAERVAEIVSGVGFANGAGPLHIQRDSGRGTEANIPTPVNVEATLAGSGRPLEPGLRRDMEGRFGHDFSQVRVHTDAGAGQSAQAIDAQAYTAGDHIVFGPARFAPGTLEGRRLLAHELTHVAQQSPVVRPYRSKKAFNFGKLDEPGLVEDSFDVTKDKEKKPWVKLVAVQFAGQKADADGNNYWDGTAAATYYDNPVKQADFSFGVAGGSPELGRTDKGSFTVHRIEGVGYNSGSNSGTAGVDYDPAQREGPNKRYSKDLAANMSYAVFYNGGEALHAGPLDYSSHGCVHVDWTDFTNIKRLNYHSVIGLTKVTVKYP